MLNNNAELDNGVYNENDEKPLEEEAKGKSPEKVDDGLMGLNMPMENNMIKEDPNNENSGLDSMPPSNIHSLNNSQEMIDREKTEKIEELFGYEQEYLISQIENDELTHATTTYFLFDQQKEF